MSKQNGSSQTTIQYAKNTNHPKAAFIGAFFISSLYYKKHRNIIGVTQIRGWRIFKKVTCNNSLQMLFSF
jgi:hypothetical protein